MMHRLFLIGFYLFLSTLLVGQADDSLSQNQTTYDAYGIFDAFKGNPGKAALYSLILPGAGQFYNRRYWKVPLALAAEAAAIYLLNQNIHAFRKWDEEWKFQLLNGTNNPDVTAVYDPAAIKRIRDNARQNKDYSWLGVIGIHILAAAEAFIDRHLIEFDVSDDLSLKLSPAGAYGGMALSLNF
jgi:hypothetical protein